MRKKFVLSAVIACVAASLLALSACGGGTTSAVSYKDGTYKGQSSVHTGGTADDGEEAANGYGAVELTIEGGKISSCTYTTYETDGTLKGSDYGMVDGKVSNRDYYNKAQKAIAACDEYAKRLVANGSLDGIDTISGATINYDEFVEAVNDALSQAKAS